jgi:hypothetical protein
MEVILIALLVMVVVLSGLSQKRSNRVAERSRGRGGIVANATPRCRLGSSRSAVEPGITHASLRRANGRPVLWRSSNALAVNTTADPISEPADGSIDYSKNVIAGFQNHDGLCASHHGRDLAQLVYTASRAVHVGDANRDSCDAALVPVNRELDTSLHPLLQTFVPNDIACSNSNFHG